MNADSPAAANPSGIMPGGLTISKSTDRSLELRVPARPEFLAVVRRALSGFAARMGLDQGVAEEFTIAVNEACTAAIVTDGRDLAVSLGATDGRVEAQIVHAPAPGAYAGGDVGRAQLLSTLVLFSLADVVQSETGNGTIVTRISKGRTAG